MTTLDYEALARQHGGVPVVDFEALAKKFGGVALESKPVHHASNDVEDLRASAERQAPKLGDAVSAAVEAVPGAKLEAVRDSKDSDRIEDKVERQGIQPSQVGDVAAAKVTVPHQEAANQVLQNLHEEMPVESAEGKVSGESGKNNVRQTQAMVDTKAPSGEPVRKAEVILQTPEMAKATDETHDDYRKAQELRAAGKEAEAQALETEIAKTHQAAEQDARERQENTNAKGSNTTQEKERASGSTGSDATQSPETSRQKEKARPVGSAPIPPLARRPNASPAAQVQSPVQSQSAPPATAPAENQPAGSAATETNASTETAEPKSDFASIVARLPELQDKLSTSVRAPRPPGENLKGQRVEVKDPQTGEWKLGEVLNDAATPNWTGGTTIRRLRGMYDDGTKFNNVDIANVRKPLPKAPDVAVDFDGTLAKETGGDKLGEPLSERVKSVKKMLDEGKSVVIFTRRVENDPGGKVAQQIQDWLEKAGLPRLPVTDIKEAQQFFDNNAHHAPTDANTPLIRSNNARKA